eukprot:COSAG02_NODE_50391_length_320_cov_3.628959_1_plen_39_part_10
MIEYMSCHVLKAWTDTAAGHHAHAPAARGVRMHCDRIDG